MYTEAVTTPTQMHNIGAPRPRTFETPSQPLWCLGQANSESPVRIGVMAVWPRPQKSSISDGLHENYGLVNVIGPSCRQVVNQQISQPSGAVPWEASPSSGVARLPERASLPHRLRQGGGHLGLPHHRHRVPVTLLPNPVPLFPSTFLVRWSCH